MNFFFLGGGGGRSHVNADFLNVNGAVSSLYSAALNGGNDECGRMSGSLVNKADLVHNFS
jgi:hypothetical protein